MLYCQDLSLALFDQGGDEGSPTPLRPLGLHFSLIPQMLFHKCFSLRCSGPYLTTTSLCEEEFRPWELLGLTFALPPVSCSGWVDGAATSSSPRTCLHSQGRALLPSSLAVGPEHPPLGINPRESKLSPRPLVGCYPGAGQRMREELLSPQVPQHCGLQGFGRKSVDRWKRQVWRPWRWRSGQGGPASGFDWNLVMQGGPGRRGVPWSRGGDGQGGASSHLRSLAPDSSAQGWEVPSHQTQWAISMPGPLLQEPQPRSGSTRKTSRTRRASPYQASNQSHKAQPKLTVSVRHSGSYFSDSYPPRAIG